MPLLLSSCFHVDFFRTEIFPDFFGFPFQFFDFLHRMDVTKSRSVPLLPFFGTLTLFKVLIFRFFPNFPMSPKGPSIEFQTAANLLIFCNKLDFQKTQRVPLYTIFGIASFFKMIVFRLKVWFQNFSVNQHAISEFFKTIVFSVLCVFFLYVLIDFY